MLEESESKKVPGEIIIMQILHQQKAPILIQFQSQSKYSLAVLVYFDELWINYVAQLSWEFVVIKNQFIADFESIIAGWKWTIACKLKLCKSPNHSQLNLKDPLKAFKCFRNRFIEWFATFFWILYVQVFYGAKRCNEIVIDILYKIK